MWIWVNRGISGLCDRDCQEALIGVIERNEPGDAVWLLDRNGRLRFKLVREEAVGGEQ
jgi:hypothetical protein